MELQGWVEDNYLRGLKPTSRWDLWRHPSARFACSGQAKN